MRLNTYRIIEACGCRGLISATLLILLFTFACSRPVPNVPSGDATQSRSTPFETQTTNAADHEVEQPTPAQASDAELPFENSESIPAGTLLLVSLKASLVIDSRSHQDFKGMLDEPVLVDGNTLIPRDAAVSGLIESAHFSNTSPERDYVRLVLSAVEIDGLSVPIQTASLFARRQHSAHTGLGKIRLEKGRRLTFRLNKPIFLHSHTAKATP